jgi:hypothetical protein
MEGLGRLAETRYIPAQPAGHIRNFGGGGQLTKAYEVHCEPWDQASICRQDRCIHYHADSGSNMAAEVELWG